MNYELDSEPITAPITASFTASFDWAAAFADTYRALAAPTEPALPSRAGREPDWHLQTVSEKGGRRTVVYRWG